MKNFYLLTFLSAFFSLTSLSVRAQSEFKPGYVVTTANDTLQGWVDKRGFQRSARICTFKRSEAAEPQSYTPQQIKAYRILEGRAYVSKEVKIDSLTQETLFLEILIGGKATLYYYKGAEANHYLVEVNNEGVNELLETERLVERKDGNYIATIKRYVGLLKYLLADCNRINPIIEESDMSEKSLISVIEQYNQCMALGGALYKPYQPAVAFRAGVIAGKVGASAHFANEPGYTIEAGYYNAPTSVMFGAFLRTLLPRINEKFCLQIEALYIKNQYDTYREFKDTYRIKRSSIQMDFTYLKIPLLLQYTIPLGKLQPYVQAGGYTAFVLNSSGSRYDETELLYTHSVDAKTNDLFSMKKNQQGWLAGLGAQYNLTDHYFVFLGGRYEKGNGLDYQPGINTSTSSVKYLSVFLGVGF